MASDTDTALFVDADKVSAASAAPVQWACR